MDDTEQVIDTIDTIDTKEKDYSVTKSGRRKKLKCWSCHTPLTNFDSSFNYQCPECNASYANKPLNEAKLSILQDDYLETRNTKTLNKMMIIINDLVYNLICSKLKASGKYLDEDDVYDKVQWTLLKMTYYYSKPEFKIGTSFTEYLKQVILYPLYNYKQKDKDSNELSLFTPIGDDDGNGKDKTLIDRLSDMPYLEGKNEVENYLFNEIEKDNIVNIVKDYIRSLTSVANKQNGFTTALKLMILYKHYFNKSTDRFFSNWWNTEGVELKGYFEKSQTLLKNAIYESMK